MSGPLYDAALVARRRQQNLAGGTGDARAVTPSTRAFGLAIEKQRQQVERLPLLLCARPDLLEVAAALDQAEVAALAVWVDEPALELDALLALSQASSVPVLRCDPLLEERQLYQSRAAGCDAVLLSAALLGAQLGRLTSVARGTHMAACVLCESAAEVAQAVAARADVFVLPCGAEGLDPALLAGLPKRALVLAAPERDRAADRAGSGSAPAAAGDARTIEAMVARLLGLADAVLDAPLALAPDPAAAFRAALAVAPSPETASIEDLQG